MGKLDEQEILGAARHLEAARDVFFSISRNLMTEDEADWQDVEFYFNASRKVEVLRREILTHREFSGNKPINDDSLTRHEPIGRTRAEENQKPRNTVSKRRKADYPKYVIRNSSLIRIGLSRDRRSEYEHVVGIDELRKITERLAHFLSVEQFVVNEVQEGLEVPIYQTYLVTTLLRELGILELIRRGVYRFGDVDESQLVPSKVHERVRGLYKNGN
jgi:hypothetical protein